MGQDMIQSSTATKQVTDLFSNKSSGLFLNQGNKGTSISDIPYAVLSTDYSHLASASKIILYYRAYRTNCEERECNLPCNKHTFVA